MKAKKYTETIISKLRSLTGVKVRLKHSSSTRSGPYTLTGFNQPRSATLREVHRLWQPWRKVFSSQPPKAKIQAPSRKTSKRTKTFTIYRTAEHQQQNSSKSLITDWPAPHLSKRFRMRESLGNLYPFRTSRYRTTAKELKAAVSIRQVMVDRPIAA